MKDNKYIDRIVKYITKINTYMQSVTSFESLSREIQGRLISIMHGKYIDF